MNEKLMRENFNLDVSGYADFDGREMEVIAEIFATAPTLSSLIPQGLSLQCYCPRSSR